MEARGLGLQKLERTAGLLRVLGHPTRLKLIELLARDRWSVGELAERVRQKPHVVSEHLNDLRMHGLLRRQRVGRAVYYRIDHPLVMHVLRWAQTVNREFSIDPGGGEI